jgi:hypothetical protein
MGHVNTTSKQELLHDTVGQGKLVVESDPMADNFAWKARVLIAIGVNGQGHSGCLTWYSTSRQRVIAR